MKTKAYKVVTNDNGSYYSAIVYKKEGVSVQYIPGQWVGPRIDGSKLFVFEDLHSAKVFAGASGLEVWACEIDEVVNIQPKYILDNVWANPINFINFWQGIFNSPPNNIPNGTLFCNYIKLLHRVDV
jgi:hypothetical protein